MNPQKNEFSYQGKVLVFSMIIISSLLVIISIFSIYRGLTIISEIPTGQTDFKEFITALFTTHREGAAYLFISFYSILLAIVFAVFAVVAKIKR